MASDRKDDTDRPALARVEAVSQPATDATLRRIGDALTGIRYGSVLAIVQDGVVVQIERTEKTRYTR